MHTSCSLTSHPSSVSYLLQQTRSTRQSCTQRVIFGVGISKWFVTYGKKLRRRSTSCMTGDDPEHELNTIRSDDPVFISSSNGRRVGGLGFGQAPARVSRPRVMSPRTEAHKLLSFDPHKQVFATWNLFKLPDLRRMLYSVFISHHSDILGCLRGTRRSDVQSLLTFLARKRCTIFPTWGPPASHTGHVFLLQVLDISLRCPPTCHRSLWVMDSGSCNLCWSATSETLSSASGIEADSREI